MNNDAKPETFLRQFLSFPPACSLLFWRCSEQRCLLLFTVTTGCDSISLALPCVFLFRATRSLYFCLPQTGPNDATSDDWDLTTTDSPIRVILFSFSFHPLCCITTTLSFLFPCPLPPPSERSVRSTSRLEQQSRVQKRIDCIKKSSRFGSRLYRRRRPLIKNDETRLAIKGFLPLLEPDGK